MRPPLDARNEHAGAREGERRKMREETRERMSRAACESDGEMAGYVRIEEIEERERGRERKGERKRTEKGKKKRKREEEGEVEGRRRRRTLR